MCSFFQEEKACSVLKLYCTTLQPTMPSQVYEGEIKSGTYVNARHTECKAVLTPSFGSSSCHGQQRFAPKNCILHFVFPFGHALGLLSKQSVHMRA